MVLIILAGDVETPFQVIVNLFSGIKIRIKFLCKNNHYTIPYIRKITSF